jgi:plastocyanin
LLGHGDLLRIVSAKLRAGRHDSVTATSRGSRYGDPMRTLVVMTAAVMLVAAPAASAAKSYPTRIQVVAKEFSYTLSRGTVSPGPAIVQLVNFGEDAHDLRMERVGGTRVYGTPVVQPGAYYNLSVKLLPGKYLLWCSIANHRALGMQATLLVKKTKK